MPKNIYICSLCGKFTEEKMHCGKATKLFLDGKKRVHLSKLISLILRHTPPEFNVRIYIDGCANISELVSEIKKKTNLKWITEQHIRAIAELDPKGRFEIKRNLIRARYGHSIAIMINLSYQELTEEELPDVLYHGTVSSRLQSIFQQGLLPMRRRLVHLSLNINDAIEVGRRHVINKEDKVVILRINPKKVLAAGYRIFKASERVFLTERVPPEAISI